jgi:hypothetical protein
MRPYSPRCNATIEATEAWPCTVWLAEFGEQAQAVAGGGVTPGRLRDLAARAVSERAAESLRGVHRCQGPAGHIERFHDRHGCACSYEWRDRPDDTA